jgi:prepilin-type N-terminal cleavage/methylation domain-containing protein
MRRAPHGFTMLELLTAITLMALLAGSLYSSLFIGIKAHRSTISAVEPARAAALTLELLRQDFDAALPPNGVLAGAFTGIDGVGESDSLSFFSCANMSGESSSASDIRKVELSVETVADEPLPVLMRRLTTNLLASNDPTVREQVLCRHIKFFDIRYYDGSTWLDSWDSTGQDNVIPTAVEVTLEFVLTPEQQDVSERIYRISRIFKLACGAASQSNTLDDTMFGLDDL